METERRTPPTLSIELVDGPRRCPRITTVPLEMAARDRITITERGHFEHFERTDRVDRVDGLDVPVYRWIYTTFAAE